MKSSRKVFFLIVIFAMFSVFVGCSKDKYDSGLKENLQDKQTAIKTKYCLVTKDFELIEYLPEDSPIINEIIDRLFEYNNLKVNIDYRNYEGNEWYNLYHSERLKEAIENVEDRLLRAEIRRNKFISKFLDIDVKRVAILDTETVAIVDADIRYLLENSVEEYMERIDAKKGDELVTPLRYVLRKEKGEWKIYLEDIRNKNTR